MGFLILILGLIVFLVTHLFVTMRDRRAAAIARLGLNTYRAMFTIVSLVGLTLIVWGYADSQMHQWIQVWSPPAFMRHITVGLMLPATIVLPVPLPDTVRRERRPLITQPVAGGSGPGGVGQLS